MPQGKRGAAVTTSNIARIRIDGSGRLTLDEQKFPDTGEFERKGKVDQGRRAEGLRKRHGLQGPVDDAFVESFLCVRPTGSGTKATAYGLEVLATAAARLLQVAARRAAREGG